MTTAEFLSSLRERDVRLWAEDGRLKCDAPPGVLDDELRAQLAARKQELLSLIAEAETTLGAPRSLVPLKPTGEYPPLFARPGHNGDVFCYRPLAEPSRPAPAALRGRAQGSRRQPDAGDGRGNGGVRGGADPSVSSPRARTTSRATAPGGTIAFESARQLAHAGADVARVLLVR